MPAARGLWQVLATGTGACVPGRTLRAYQKLLGDVGEELKPGDWHKLDARF